MMLSTSLDLQRRLPLDAPGVNFRMARISLGGSPSPSPFATGSATNCGVRVWPIQFVDGGFDASNPASQLPSAPLRRDTIAYAAAHQDDRFCDGCIVPVMRSNDRWWILTEHAGQPSPCPSPSPSASRSPSPSPSASIGPTIPGTPCGCEASMARFWTATLSGIVTGTDGSPCDNCDLFNAAFSIDVGPTGCGACDIKVAVSTTPPTCGINLCLIYTGIPGVWKISTNSNLSVGGIIQVARIWECGDFDCLEPNTFTVDPLNLGRGCSGWPDTITLSPA